MTKEKRRLVLDEEMHLCSGVACPMKSYCHRFRLDRFYALTARRPHPHPAWVEPAYDGRERGCPFFVNVRFRE